MSSRIAVVDSSVQNHADLIAGLPADVQVLLIDGSSGDGWQQLATRLSGYPDIGELHIFSHGAAGSVQLGGQTLNTTTLAGQAAVLADIGSHLADGADVLLYGCSVGAGDEGRAFISQFASAVGADVAASDDPTGAAALGGDWVLEATTGNVEASSLEVDTYAEGVLGITASVRTILSGVNIAAITVDNATGTIYAAEQSIASRLFKINPNGSVSTVTTDLTGSNNSANGFYPFNYTDIQYYNGDVYTVSSTGQLDKINVSTGARTVVYTFANFGYETGLDVTPNGKLIISDGYGSANALWQYDPATGVATQILSSAPVYSYGIEYDDISGKLFLSDNTGKLYSVDINSHTYQNLLGSAATNYAIEPGGNAAYFRSGTNIVKLNLSNGATSTVISGLSSSSTIQEIQFGTSSSGSGISLYVADGSSIVEFRGLVAAINSSPTIGNNATTAFTEQTAVAVSSNIAVSDSDNNWNGGSLKVQITTNNSSGDSLTLPTSNPGGSAIWLDASGNKLMSGSTQIGTASAALVTDGAAWTFTFTNATNALVQDTAAAVKFNNGSDAPSTASRTVTFTVTDNVGASASAAQTIAVTAVNDAPSIISDGGGAIAAVSVAENTTAVTTVTATDVDSASLTYSIVSGDDSSKFSINALTGALTFVSAPNREVANDVGGDSVYDVTVRVSDGSSSDDQTIAVTVTDVNDNAPLITSGQTFSVAENATNGTVVGSVATTDADADGVNPAKTFSITAGNANGAFAVNASTGQITVADGSQLNYESASSAALTVQVSDGVNAATSQTVAVNLSDVNEAPQPPTTTVDTTTVLAGENQVLTAAPGTLVAYGRAGYSSWAYQTVGASGTLTISNAVFGDPLPNVPKYAYLATSTALPDQAVDEDVGYGYTVPVATFTDADTAHGDVLTYSATLDNGQALPSWLTFNAATRTFSGTPTNGDTGAISVKVTATDAAGLTASDTYVLTINQVNDAPMITSNAGGDAASVSVAENSTAVTTVTATDVDNVTLSYSIVGGADASKFSINASTGALSFVEAPNYETPADSGVDNVYDVTVSVSDGTLTDDQAIAVTVTNVNDNAPVVTAGQTFAVAENAANGAVVGSVSVTDADAAAVNPANTFSITGGNTNGAFAINAATGQITVADGSKLDYESASSAALTVQVSDGVNAATAQTVTVNLSDVNEAPTAVTLTAVQSSIAENSDVSGGVKVATIMVSDDALGSETLAVTGADSAQFEIRNNGTELWFKGTSPDYEAKSSYQVAVTADDASIGAAGSVEATSATFTLAVSNVNESPVITSPLADASGSAGLSNGLVAQYRLDGSAVDSVGGYNGQLVNGPTYAAGHSDQGIVFNGSNWVQVDSLAGHLPTGNAARTVSFWMNPATLSSGSANIVSWGDGDGTANQRFSILQYGANLYLIGQGNDYDMGSVLTGGWQHIAVTYDGGTLKLFSNGTEVYSRSGITFATSADGLYLGRNVHDRGDERWSGTLDDVSVYDRALSTAEVQALKNGGAPASVSVSENTSTVLTVAATDVDSGTLTYSIVGGADSGKFDIDGSTGALTFKTAPNYESAGDAGGNNVYDVTVQVSDGSATAQQAIAVTVTDVNDNAPVVTAGQTFSVAENVANGAVVGSVVVTDADAAGVNPANTFSITGGNANGAFAINAATGQITVADGSKLDFEGATSQALTVQVTDGTINPGHAGFDIEVAYPTGGVTIGSFAAADALLAGTNRASTVLTTAPYIDFGPANHDHFANNLPFPGPGGDDFALKATTNITIPTSGTWTFGKLSDDGFRLKIDGQVVWEHVGGGDTFKQLDLTSGVHSLEMVFYERAGGENVVLYAQAGAHTSYNTGFRLVGDTANGGLAASTSTVNASTQTVTVQLADVNEAPTAVTLTAVQSTIAENANVSGGVMVATIAVSDDALGDEALGLVGADAAQFEIREGHQLWFKGDALNFEAKSSYQVAVTADDETLGAAGSVEATSATFTLAVTNVNEAPVADASGTLAYTENQAATAVASALALSDVDSSSLTGATVQISGNFQSGADVLAFTTQNGITGNWNATTGTLTLTGTATVANYQAALRSITYANSSDNPSTADRTVSFQVSDGALSSALSTHTVTVAAVNDAPVRTGGSGGNALDFDGSNDKVTLSDSTGVPVGNSSYTLEAWIKPDTHGVNGIIGWGTWGAGNQVNALRLDSGNGLVNYWWGNDLRVTPGNLADGQWHHVAATFDGTTRKIYVDGVLMGQDTPSGHSVSSASNLTIGSTNNGEYFDGGIDSVRVWSVARTQAQIQSDMGSALTGSELGLVLNYEFDQGVLSANNAGVSTLTDSAGVANTGVLQNFALSGTSSNWVAGAGARTGTEDTSFTLTRDDLLQGWSDAEGNTLSITAPTADHGTVVVNADGSVTVTPEADYNGAITLSYGVSDGVTTVETSLSTTLAAVNDAPVAEASGTLAYTENQAATAVASALTLSDVDSSSLTGATVQISGGYQSGADALAFTTQNGITGSWNATTGTLTLTGTATVDNYQAALRSITYANSSDNPSTADRTVSFQVNDGSAVSNLSAVSTHTVTVAAVNDAPTMSLSGIGGGSTLIYQVDNPVFSNNAPVYTIDASAANAGLSFDRVHYRMQTTGDDGKLYYADVSFDAWSGLTVSQLAVPTGANNIGGFNLEARHPRHRRV
jgi:hypothetical protein